VSLDEPDVPLSPQAPPGTAWIDDLTDEQCMEILWLYIENAEAFFARYPAALLGAATRHALRLVARDSQR